MQKMTFDVFLHPVRSTPEVFFFFCCLLLVDVLPLASFSPDDSTILLLYFDLFVIKVPCVPLFRSFDVRMGSPTCVMSKPISSILLERGRFRLRRPLDIQCRTAGGRSIAVMLKLVSLREHLGCPLQTDQLSNDSEHDSSHIRIICQSEI